MHKCVQLRTQLVHSCPKRRGNGPKRQQCLKKSDTGSRPEQHLFKQTLSGNPTRTDSLPFPTALLLSILCLVINSSAFNTESPFPGQIIASD